MYIRTTTCVNGVARRRHDRQRSIQYQCRKSGQIPTSTKETRVYFVFCVFLFSVFPVTTPKTLNPPTHTHTHTHTHQSAGDEDMRAGDKPEDGSEGRELHTDAPSSAPAAEVFCFTFLCATDRIVQRGKLIF